MYAFWRAVLSSPDELCARIENTCLTIDEWQAQRSIYFMAPDASLDLAFATFFLNRTNRSGIIYKGGVIGGLEQAGPWKINARFNREDLCRRIQKVARFRTRITITQLDAWCLLSHPAHTQTRRIFYLDPPYYVKGRGLYDDFYDHSDHERIAKAVQSLTCPWIVSYDAVPEILEIYQASKSLRYSLSYSASTKQQGSEVMFFSDSLTVPAVRSAAGVSSNEVDAARLQMVFGETLF